MNVFINGLITGLILQLAIGPVFFFVINLALQRSALDGILAVLAVTLVDYLYITFAILGVGKLLERQKIKKVFGVISSIVLIIFGILIIYHVSDSGTSVDVSISATSLIASFTSAFFLTILSPMTIVFWTSLFATKATEYNYTKRELFIFGLSTGLATLLFMGGSVIVFSIAKKAIPLNAIYILNSIVGVLLIFYGVIRLVKVTKNKIFFK